MTTIDLIEARQISIRAASDHRSRCRPVDGSVGRAVCRTGASTGVNEAVELRDGDKTKSRQGRPEGRRQRARDHRARMLGTDASDQADSMPPADRPRGTPNRASSDANAILGVSLAAAHACCASSEMPHSNRYPLASARGSCDSSGAMISRTFWRRPQDALAAELVLSPSRSSTASLTPVERPTATRTPDRAVRTTATSTSMVGLPRASRDLASFTRSIVCQSTPVGRTRRIKSATRIRIAKLAFAASSWTRVAFTHRRADTPGASALRTLAPYSQNRDAGHSFPP